MQLNVQTSHKKHVQDHPCARSALLMPFSSAVTEGNKKVWWNEKFVFKLSPSEWKDVTKLRLSIMEKDKFHEDHFAGEAT